MGCGPDDTGTPEGDTDTDADTDTDTDTDTIEATVTTLKSLSFMNVYVDDSPAEDCTDDECAYPVSATGTYSVSADCDDCLFVELDVDVTGDGDFEVNFTREGAGGLAPDGTYISDGGNDTEVYTFFYEYEGKDLLLMNGLSMGGLYITGNQIYKNTNEDRDDCYIYGDISQDLRTIHYIAIWEGEEVQNITYTLVD